MWCALAHCLVEGLTWRERQKAVSFYPGRQGPRPPGWQPALADAGVDFSGLPTDRSAGFDDIEAFELRNAGRVEVFVFVWQQTLWTDGLEYYHVLQQRDPSGGRRPARRTAASPAQRPLQPSALGKCRCPGPRLLRYRGKASAELAPLTCYADLEVYSTPAPTVHIAQQQPARQTVAASSCYVAVGRCYAPPEELRLRLSDKYHAVRAMLNDLLKPTTTSPRPVSMTRREAGAQGRRSLQGVPRVLRDR